MNRKKSIFLSLAIIGVAATMITAATSAVFTDQVVNTGNQLSAGTLNLAVDSQCAVDVGGGDGGGAACPATFTWTETATALTIGDEVTHTFSIANVGSLPGDLTYSVAITPGLPADADSYNETVDTAPAASLDAAGGAADETTMALTVALDANGASAPTDNECQGATATVAVTFTLTQQP